MRTIYRRFTAPAIKSYSLNIDGIEISVAHKKIRTLRIGINGKNGKVSASAPAKVSEEKVKSFIISKIDWIKKHQSRIGSHLALKLSKPKLEILEGEIHHLFGKPCLVRVCEVNRGRGKVTLEGFPVAYSETSGVKSAANLLSINRPTITFQIKLNSTFKQREKLLQNFYKQQLKDLIPSFVHKWEKFLNVSSSGFTIRNMKSRWGTCNIRSKHITLALNLATKPVECLEYVVVHELVHLIERQHNQRFYRMVEKCLPDWRERKRVMNEGA